MASSAAGRIERTTTGAGEPFEQGDDDTLLQLDHRVPPVVGRRPLGVSVADGPFDRCHLERVVDSSALARMSANSAIRVAFVSPSAYQ
jgi:hypothetical protein